jgi:hypothetical protein
LYLLVNTSKLEQTAKYIVTDEELISFYYRPITNFVAASDVVKNRSMALFVDRPVAGTSRLPGQLEIIFERKTLSSDWRGVSEITNDDYDGFMRYDLVFYSSCDPDEIRKDQAMQDLEALQMIGSAIPNNLKPATDNFTQALYTQTVSECFSLDIMPVDKIPGYLDLQITITNLCKSVVHTSTLTDLISACGIDITLVSSIDPMTADGRVKIASPSHRKLSR